MTSFRILTHPRAGSLRAGARLATMLREAPSPLREARVVPVATMEDAEAALRELPPDALLVAGGGDGTVNLVVRALRAVGQADRPLGILPAGTGNALAHTLGVGNPREAIAALLNPTVRRLDLFLTTHPAAPLAVCTLSLGYEAEILRGVAAFRGRTRLARGAWAALRHAVGPTQGATVTIDGGEVLGLEDTFFNLGLYNIPHYAFGRLAHPAANPSDGRGHAVLHVRPATYWRSVLRPSDTDGGAATRSFTTCRVESTVPFQVDGEFVEGARFDLSVEPAVLPVLGR